MKIAQYMPKSCIEAAYFAAEVLSIPNPNPNRPDSVLRLVGRVAASLVALPVVAVFSLPVVGFPALLVGAPLGILTHSAVSAAAVAFGADSGTAAQLALASGVAAAGVTSIAAGFKIAQAFTGEESY